MYVPNEESGFIKSNQASFGIFTA